MKVLHVFKTYHPDTVGGIEQVIAQLGCSLAARGHENRVYTLSPNPRPRMVPMPEGEVHRSRMTWEVASVPLSLPALVEFREQARWADVIHYQYPWPFADVLHFLWGRNKPSVVSYQSDIVKQKLGLKMYAPVRELFLRSVDAVVTTSPQYRESSAVLANLPRDVRIIPNGIDPAAYPAPSQEALARWRERVGEGFFLFVGVLRYYKGLGSLLAAAEGLPTKVVIAGDGPEREGLQRTIARKNLANVELLGRISEEDKVCLLHLCRAFVFPSHLRSEAFGMSLVEAAMLGKPMVTCEIGTGTSFVNADGVTGCVVPPDDAPSLRAALERLHAEPDAAQAMGAAARRRFADLFTADTMVRQYEALYRELLTAKR